MSNEYINGVDSVVGGGGGGGWVVRVGVTLSIIQLMWEAGGDIRYYFQ